MRRIFRLTTSVVIAAAVALSAWSCADDPVEDINGGEEIPEDVEHMEEYAKLFSLLDLTYPGMERVAEAYAWGRDAEAVELLLEYYRMRTGLDNPQVAGVLTTNPSDAERERADRALNYEFYSNGLFKNYWDEAAGKIDWTITGLADDEARYQLHRHQWLLPQGKSFLRDRTDGVGDYERYARSWMEVYSDWLVQNPRVDGVDYSVSPTHMDTPEKQNSAYAWRSLEAAARVNTQCQLLDYFRNSESLTGEWWGNTFLVNFADHVDWISNNLAADGNHRITQAQAILTAGAIYPEFKDAKKWLSSGNEILTGCFDQFFDDGMHYEFDFSYYLGALDQFWTSWGLISDLENVTTDAGLSSQLFVDNLTKAVEPAMYLIFPDYRVVNMSDTRSGQLYGTNGSIMVKNLTHYLDWYPENETLRWFATKGKQGVRPSDDALLKCFPDAGYYAIRNGWDANSTMMVLKNSFDANNKWHNQPDNGTFELYVNGRHFFPDSGCYAYAGTSTNKSRAMFRRTRSHNTISFLPEGKTDDEWGSNTNITKREGKLLKAERAAQMGDAVVDMVVTENAGYSNLTHRRGVMMVDGKFFVIIDEATGSARGDVRLHYHLVEGSEVALDLAENGAHTEFADGNNILVRTFSPQSIFSTEFAGYVSYKEGESSERKAYDVVAEKGSDWDVRFVTVILPVDSAQSHEVAAEFVGNYSATGASVKVTVDGKEYNLSYTLN